MFAYVLGVLLPSTSFCDQLESHKDLVDDLVLEIEEYLIKNDCGIKQIVWWSTTDGGCCGEYLHSRLQEICTARSYYGFVDIRELQMDLDFWVRDSHVVIMMRDEEETESLGDYLIRKRWSETATTNITCMQRIAEDIDNAPTWERYQGSKYLMPGCRIDKPALGISNLLSEMGAEEGNPISLGQGEIRSSSLARGLRTSYRARAKAHYQQKISDRQLLGKGVLLLVASILIGLRLGSTTAPFVMMVLGVGLMSRQPLRRRAHMWWSVGEMIWLQTIWSDLGFDQAKYSVSIEHRTGGISEEPTVLAIANKLFTVAQPLKIRTPTLQSLRDLRSALEERKRMLAQKVKTHSVIRRFSMLLVAVWVIMAIAGLILDERYMIGLSIYSISMSIACTQLSSPVPLVREDRLLQAVSELQDLICRSDMLVFESREDSGLIREEIHEVLLQTGVHIHDMYEDGMRAIRARRRLIPWI